MHPSPLGDPHHFGRRVRFSEWGGHKTLEKPRTVFWEWLFFGQNSPLRPLFEQKNPDFSYSISGLTVIDKQPHRGQVLQVQPTHTETPSARAFGALLAYSYKFGIQDLHHENVIPTASGSLQVIDAEVVLSNLYLPAETHLLPHQSTGRDRCGLSALFRKPIELPFSESFVQELLSGFVEMLRILGYLSPQILETLHTHRHEITQTPIRVLLRNTAVYRNPALPLLPAELEQLERGDIPYFFKYMGRPELFYFTSQQWDHAPVENLPPSLQAIVTRAGQPFETLLNPVRIQQTLLPTGVLALCDDLLPPECVGTLQDTHYTAEILKTGIRATLGQVTFECKRRTTTPPKSPQH